MTTFNTAVAVLEAVTAAERGANVEVARHRTVVITAAKNAYKRGFAVSVVASDGSHYGVCGCARAKDASIDVMVAKARAYADKYQIT
jgi:hypothetical protein